MYIDGMHVLAVIPPDHTAGIVLGVIGTLGTIFFFWMLIDSLVEGMYVWSFVFFSLIVLAALISVEMYTQCYTPQQYKVTVTDLSHFDYAHWKIVDQEGAILTIERVDP
jgi:apolipoprotein N-acyltransferase